MEDLAVEAGESHLCLPVASPHLLERVRLEQLLVLLPIAGWLWYV